MHVYTTGTVVPQSLQVTVTAVAARLKATKFMNANATNDVRARSGVVVKNTDGAATVYLGSATVSTTTGYPLKPGEALSIATDDPYNIWAVGSASAVVAVLWA